MMKNFSLTFILLLCLTTTGVSQELSIIVYKGTVNFDNTKEHLLLKTRYDIFPNTMVTYDYNSKFIIFSSNKIYKKTGNGGATLHYKQIIENLKFTAPKHFLSLMKTYHDFTKTEFDSKGSVIGAPRGLNDKKNTGLTESTDKIYPPDSSKTNSNVLELRWDLKNSIMNGKLYVIHTPTSDTLYTQSASNSGKATVTIEKQGTYHWFIYSKTDKKKRINHCFIKTTYEEYQKLLFDFEEFKKGLSVLDEEIQDILIQEYKWRYGMMQ